MAGLGKHLVMANGVGSGGTCGNVTVLRLPLKRSSRVVWICLLHSMCLDMTVCETALLGSVCSRRLMDIICFTGLACMGIVLMHISGRCLCVRLRLLLDS